MSGGLESSRRRVRDGRVKAMGDETFQVGMADDDEGHRLVQAARNGDAWALTTLYRAHHPALCRFLRGLVGGEAEDLASEAWIDMARALVRIEGGLSEFRRLLYTIARRRAIDHARKVGRRQTSLIEPDLLDEVASSNDPAEELIELDSSERAIKHITAVLPKPQAEVVLLRVVAGLSVNEVATVMGLKPAAVSVLQTRALRRLAGHLRRSPRWERNSEHR